MNGIARNIEAILEGLQRIGSHLPVKYWEGPMPPRGRDAAEHRRRVLDAVYRAWFACDAPEWTTDTKVFVDVPAHVAHALIASAMTSHTMNFFAVIRTPDFFAPGDLPWPSELAAVREVCSPLGAQAAYITTITETGGVVRLLVVRPARADAAGRALGR